jgi:TolA-binding protein
VAPAEHHAAPPPAPAHEPEKLAAPAHASAPAHEPAPDTSPAAAPAAAHPPAAEKPAAHAPEKPTLAPKSLAADEIKSMLKLGPSLTDRGDYQSAEIAFRAVLAAPAATPADLKPALLGLARLHRKQGALTKAVAVYERYLKDFPGDARAPDALLDLGRTLRALGAHKLAVSRFYAVLNSTLKLEDDSFARYQLLAKTAQFEIAQTHFESGAYAEAGKYFAKLRLLDLAPGDRARAHFMSACAQRLQGDHRAAGATLREFLEHSPDDENVPEARYLLALTLRELKQPQEALAATLDLLRTEKTRTAADPKRWAYWQRRTGNQLANEFFEAGDTLNAHAIYTGLLDLAPEPVWRLPITYQIALCFERLGITDRARNAYRAIVDTAGPTPPPELAELARMAAWRLEQLTWRERVDQQVTAFFAPPAVALPTTLPAAAKAAPPLLPTQ